MDAHDIYREVLERWDRINGRPILDVHENCFDLHLTQKCRMGGRVCELCDHFQIERVEYPGCNNDCSCKLTPVLQQAIIGPEYIQKLHDLVELQFEHIAYNVIKGVRQKYPDRHVMIVEAGPKRGDDGDSVYAEVLVFRHPSWMKPIEGDHQCQCQLKELVEGEDRTDAEFFRNGRRRYPPMDKVFSWRYSDGTDYERLTEDLRRYDAIMDAEQGNADNNPNNSNENSAFEEDDWETGDEDEFSDEEQVDWEEIRREQILEFRRLAELD